MKIITYNVNGIRAAIRKGFVDWLAANDYDIVCVQETKAHPEQVDMTAIEDLGYHAEWHSATRKKGYSGLLTLSKQKPDQVVVGCGIEDYDSEGRILRTDFGDWSLFNCYFPSGTSGEERQNFKMKYLADFMRFIEEVKKERSKIIVVGDYNIAHNEIDLHNPKGNKKTSGFLPEEREWMSQWFSSGFTDTFRHLYPEKVEYSWWSMRSKTARAENRGWRIDYQSVTDNLQDKLISAQHFREAHHSDHCPMLLEINL